MVASEVVWGCWLGGGVAWGVDLGLGVQSTSALSLIAKIVQNENVSHLEMGQKHHFCGVARRCLSLPSRNATTS